MSAKLRHIAIAADDPDATATLLTDVFGLEEVGRCDNELAVGVFMSDGTISVAVLKFRNVDQLGRGLDYQGLHHVGFLVNDVAETRKRLDEAGVELVIDRPEGDTTSFFEVKYKTAADFLFDVVDQPWLGVPSPDRKENVT
jgi:methylmalonyl-CoA/ethylmalonyl-CoA epimerase